MDRTINTSHPLVDLHSHVLPAVDDGARDDQAALAMLRAAANDGVEIIAATPHAHLVDLSRVPGEVARLNELALEAGINIAVIPGSEVRIDHDLIERHQAGQLVTINDTSYLLLELFLGHELSRYTVETVVGDLQAAGLRPVLAHPERHAELQRQPDSLLGLVARGVPIQVNAGSLTGYHGTAARTAAETMVKQHLIHLVASDAHNATSRAPAIRSGLNRAAELAGSEYAEWMAGTAAAIARGEHVTLPEPVPSG